MPYHNQVATINVGNTHTSAVVWHDSRLAVMNFAWQTSRNPPGTFLKFMEKFGSPVILAGVVPARKKMIQRMLNQFDIIPFIFRGRRLPAKIEILPRPPSKVGDDRIAAALGALAFDATSAWVVVDAGTAVTVNAVTPGAGELLPRFEGGLIFAGAGISLGALSKSTAQLPLLSANFFSEPSFIGRDTEKAMSLGAYHAQTAAAIGLCKGILRELDGDANIALTGGGADMAFVKEFRREFSNTQFIYDPQLVHRGLMHAWKTQCL